MKKNMETMSMCGGARGICDLIPATAIDCGYNCHENRSSTVDINAE